MRHANCCCPRNGVEQLSVKSAIIHLFHTFHLIHLPDSMICNYYSAVQFEALCAFSGKKKTKKKQKKQKQKKQRLVNHNFQAKLYCG
jgi:hypothetical protein